MSIPIMIHYRGYDILCIFSISCECPKFQIYSYSYIINMSGSESRLTPRRRSIRMHTCLQAYVHDYYSELFIHMAGLNFLNAVAQLLLQLSLRLLRTILALLTE